jgi:hypothetical protein
MTNRDLIQLTFPRPLKCREPFFEWLARGAPRFQMIYTDKHMGFGYFHGRISRG